MVRLMIALAVVMALGLGVALDYSLEAKRRSGFPYAFAEHFGMRVAQAKAALDRRPLTDMAADGDLEALIPAAPAGWVRRELVHKDMERTTGLVTPEPTPEQQEAGKVFVAMGVRISQASYEKGDTVVQYLVTWYTEQALTGPQGAGFSKQLDAMDGAENGPVVRVVNGVKLRRRAMGSGATLQGMVGRQIRLGFISNGTDADMLEIAAALDMAGLNALNMEPAAGIGTGGVAAPDSEPVAASPGPVARIVPEVPMLAPGALIRRMLKDG
jgi:hypothetical protein